MRFPARPICIALGLALVVAGCGGAPKRSTGPLVDVDGKDRQIAVARYVTNPDGRSCEFAIVVADDWHNQGIATELLRRLIDLARDRRLEEMVGIVLRENKGMIALAKELGFEQQRAPDDPGIVIMALRL